MLWIRSLFFKFTKYFMIKTFFDWESFLEILIQHIGEKINQIVLGLFLNIERSDLFSNNFFLMRSKIFKMFLSRNHEEEKCSTWPNIILWICYMTWRWILKQRILLRKVDLFVLWWFDVRRLWEIDKFEEIIFSFFNDHYVVGMNQIVSQSLLMTII